jgi:hypothetical protein
MADNLTAIPGLEERHRRVLAQRLGITTYKVLACADLQEIFDAMSRNRPRPTLDEIREWQIQARRRLERAASEAPGWDRAASFVISFERRQVEGVTERRLVAEQTELEPEQPPSSWPSWDGGGLGDWLQERLSAAGSTPEAPTPERDAEAPEIAGASPGTGREPVTGGRELRLETIAVVDSSGRAEAVSRGRPTGVDLEGTLPARMEIRVTGGAPRSELRVALRFSEPGRPRWSPQAPITIQSHRTASLELSEAAVGRYHARVVAWAPDASVAPIGVDLGDLTIRSAGSR